MNTIYKITAQINFPEGVAPGAGTVSNRQIVSKNGRDEFILRGTALAGALRSAYRNSVGTNKADRWFGSALDEFRENESFIQISDTVLDCKTVNERTHNMVNRHTGVVAKGALFSLEATPPETSAFLSITLKSGAGSREEYIEFINDLARIFGAELLVGGNSNRGIGRMRVEGGLYLRAFDFDDIEAVAAWMDAEYEERKSGVRVQGDKVAVPEEASLLSVNLDLGVPRGEDLLVGDGQDTDYALKPQKVYFADGTEHWRIPGSSLRGIVRSWMSRLVAREGMNIRDSYDHWNRQSQSDHKADDAGWGFVEPLDRDDYQTDPSLLDDPIMDLFGSMYKKGRLHITDSFSSASTADDDVQDRMHVAIDRFSGGANEGALFGNQVLVGGTLKFSVKISVANPTKAEAKLLAKTLRAIHLGILLIGSSKSGGRLEIKSITVTGKHGEELESLCKEIM